MVAKITSLYQRMSLGSESLHQRHALTGTKKNDEPTPICELCGTVHGDL